MLIKIRKYALLFFKHLKILSYFKNIIGARTNTENNYLLLDINQ